MTQIAKQKKTTKTYTKKSKPLTLGEFRAWLSGVEEMQTEDWYPDLQQWKTIRAKIEEVIDDPAVRNQTSRNFNDDTEADVSQVIRPSGPSMLTGIDPRMVLPTMNNPNMPQIINTDTTMGGRVDRNTPVARIKTPNIDSTHGYTAAFE
jgi:hypothetical protein